MKLFLGSIVGCLIMVQILSCKGNNTNKSSGDADNPETSKDTISYSIFNNNDSSFGFDIEINGKIYIHQPVIPCRQGLQGFANSHAAAKVAELIVSKLRSKTFEVLLQKFEVDSLFAEEKQTIETVYKSIPATKDSFAKSSYTDTGNLIPVLIPLPDTPVKNKWTSKGLVPFGFRAGGFCFVKGKNVYIGSGEVNDAIFKDTWRYNTETETWTCLAEIPGKCFSGFSFSIYNKGYVGLGTEIGTSSGKFEKHVYQYDPLLNKWKQEKDFPGSGRIDPAFFVAGNKGYVGTGYDGSNTKDFYEYDPLKDAWTQIADFAGGSIHASVGISNDQSGFMVAGGQAPKAFKFVYEYMPSSNKWKQKQDLPGYSRNFLSGNYIDSNYFLAGTGGTYEIDKRLRDFYVYNIKEDSWAKTDDYPCDNNGSTRAVSGNVDGKIFMGTGFGSDEMNDWNMYEYYYSVRTDTGTYNETTCYPLNYNGQWQLYQECTSKNCYAGAEIKTSEDLGNFCYSSLLVNSPQQLSFQYSNKSNHFILVPRSFNISFARKPAQPVGIRLFFTKEEIQKMLKNFQQITGKTCFLSDIKILQYNAPNQQVAGSKNNNAETNYQIVSPQLNSYGFKGETIVASFSTTQSSGQFFLAVQLN